MIIKFTLQVFGILLYSETETVVIFFFLLNSNRSDYSKDDFKIITHLLNFAAKTLNQGINISRLQRQRNPCSLSSCRKLNEISMTRGCATLQFPSLLLVRPKMVTMFSDVLGWEWISWMSNLLPGIWLYAN